MAHYFDEQHHLHVSTLVRIALARHEWQIWALILAVHSGWCAAAWSRQYFGLVPATLLLVLCCVMHMSLQHELLHGHPTRIKWLNKLLGYAPFAVWYPYTLYRESHLRHHEDENPTYPGLNPESIMSRRRHGVAALLRCACYTAFARPFRAGWPSGR